MMLIHVLTFVLLVCSSSIFAFGVEESIPDFELVDSFGRKRAFSEFKDRQALVVVFLGSECPIANRYVPDLNALHDEYTTRGVQLLAINAAPLDSAADVARHRREFGIRFPVWRDPEHVAVKLFDAQRTPQAFVLDSKKVIRYNGRIDDRLGYTHALPKARRQDLIVALKEVLAGKKVSQPTTEFMGCIIPRDLEKPVVREVLFHRDVQPMLQNNCLSCHRPEGAAPMSFGKFAKARGWGPMMLETILDGRMPVWKADPRWGEFSNNMSLSDAEINLFADWVQGGMQRGDPQAGPPPLVWPDGWLIGEPDLVLEMPNTAQVPAKGALGYVKFNMPMGLAEDKYVKAVEIRPGNRKIVHHILTYFKGPGGKVDDPRDVYLGLESGLLEGYVPGHLPTILPDGMARKIPAGSKLYWVIHYQPTGKPEEDRSQIGFIFSDMPVKTEIKYGAAYNTDFFLEPHEKKTITSEMVFKHDAVLMGFSPHMHYRGREFRYELIYPDGRKEILLQVNDYDLDWQLSYVLKQPLNVPQGSKLFCTALMDNTKDNPRNPNPDEFVWWGEQSFLGEMMIGYFMFYWRE